MATDLCRECPIHINIGSLTLKANHAIRQEIEIFVGIFNFAKLFIAGNDTENERQMRLLQLLRELPMGKKLVFAQTKRGADMLARDMRRHHIVCQAIHGDKKQEERDRVCS